MDKKFEIWCKTKDTLGNKRKFKCKIIYQRWGEEEKPFIRRVKRYFKKYYQHNEQKDRTFYLIEE